MNLKVIDQRKYIKHFFRLIKYHCILNIIEKKKNPLGNLSRMNPKVIIVERQLKIHATEPHIQMNSDTYSLH